MYLNPGEYFDRYWTSYQKAVTSGLLYHKDVLEISRDLLSENFAEKAFSFADFGCGDCESTASILHSLPVKRFLGVDAAPNVIAKAPAMMADISGSKEFLVQDMLVAANDLEKESFDVIYSAYALHHFNTAEKANFILHCQRSLKPGGLFILVDGVRTRGQSREEWLQVMEEQTHNQSGEWQEKDHAIEHMRSSDFPETLTFFAQLAQQQLWRKFQVLYEQEYCAFMLFAKK